MPVLFSVLEGSDESGTSSLYLQKQTSLNEVR
jgi:hypothetical protein